MQERGKHGQRYAGRMIRAQQRQHDERGERRQHRDPGTEAEKQAEQRADCRAGGRVDDNGERLGDRGIGKVEGSSA
jgi:hypothetical protein